MSLAVIHVRFKIIELNWQHLITHSTPAGWAVGTGPIGLAASFTGSLRAHFRNIEPLRPLVPVMCRYATY